MDRSCAVFISEKYICMKLTIIIILFFAFLTISCKNNGRIEEISQNIESTLKADPDEIEIDLSEDPKRADSRKLITSVALNVFYEKRNFDQAWTTRKGLNSLGEELWELIKEIPKYGFNPEWYHIDEINSVLKEKKPKAEALAKIDILLTDAYMLLASHLAYGAFETGKKHVVWKWEKLGRRGELPKLLQQAWENKNIKSSLIELQPQWYEYANLQKGLQKFLDKYEINDIKHPVPDVRKDSAAAYKSISKILVELQLLDEKIVNNYEDIIESLKKFQKWHGIPVDGVIGEYTLEALAMSTADRYNQIAINLDRMRWDIVIPQKYVLVNIPAYHLKFVINNKPKEVFDVIVGTPDDQTPELVENMTYIETFPYWHVPSSIVNEEILPKILENPSRMSALGYRVLDNNNNEIDPASLSWSEYSDENFKYSIRQDGDSANSLGLIKFMFPNKHNIYIHDTPSRHLFGKEMRSFSHGCIRINEPLKFANIILKEDNNKHTSDDVKEMIIKKQNRQLKLNNPKPVIIRYFTAEGDDNGNVYLYKDIYDKDKNLPAIYSQNQMKLVSSK
jgi:L,D-transpeptidase YcbB